MKTEHILMYVILLNYTTAYFLYPIPAGLHGQSDQSLVQSDEAENMIPRNRHDRSKGQGEEDDQGKFLHHLLGDSFFEEIAENIAPFLFPEDLVPTVLHTVWRVVELLDNESRGGFR